MRKTCSECKFKTFLPGFETDLISGGPAPSLRFKTFLPGFETGLDALRGVDYPQFKTFLPGFETSTAGKIKKKIGPVQNVPSEI